MQDPLNSPSATPRPGDGPRVRLDTCETLALDQLGQALARALTDVAGDAVLRGRPGLGEAERNALLAGQDRLSQRRDAIVEIFVADLRRLGPPPQPPQPAGLRLMNDAQQRDLAARNQLIHGFTQERRSDLRGLALPLEALARSCGRPTRFAYIDPERIADALLTGLRAEAVPDRARALLAPALAQRLADHARAAYLAIKRHLAVQSPAASDPSTLDPEALLRLLGQLQRGQGSDQRYRDPAAPGLLRALSGDPLLAPGGHRARVAAEMLAGMFEAILADRRVDAGLKPSIARLQLPLFKAALLDEDFFRQNEHPARRFLELLAELARRPLAGRHRAEVELLVQHLAARYDRDAALFARSLTDLRALMAGGESETPPLAPVTEVIEAPAFNSFGYHLPKPILAFVGEHWSTLYRAFYAKAGQPGHSPADSAQALNDLMRTLAPRSWQTQRAEIVGLLPGLFKRLKEDLRGIGVNDDASDKLMTGLAKCHAMAMQLAQRLPRPETGPAAAKEPPPEGEPARQLAGLCRGDWVRFGRGGDALRYRLDWISPGGEQYLFTNQAGLRALSLGTAELLARFRDGVARPETPSRRVA